MKFVRSTGYIRLIIAILYIASFTIIVLFPNLYSVRHVAILTVLLALTLLATQKSPIHRQVIRDVLLIAATIGVLEACIGLSHVNHLAIITGTFDNPTLFSMAISLSVPALLYFLDTEDKRIRYLVILCFIILSLAVVLSKSRTGILSMSVVALLLLRKICKIRRRLFIGISAIFVVGLFITMLLIKSESTTGRSFILARTLEMIKDRPSGWGINGFSKHYMEYQADYFMQSHDEQHAFLADDIRHPLNEFILVTVNWGIMGLLLTLLLIVYTGIWLHKKDVKEKNIIFMFMAILFLWALFAYPTTLPFVGLFASVYFLPLVCRFWCRAYRYANVFIIIGSLVGMVYTIIDLKYRHDWEKGVTFCKKGKCEESLAIMEQIANHYKHNNDFLYSYATVLYNCSFYEKTISILQRYKESCTSYEAELMLANSYMFIGQNDMAEKSYTLAHYMCPVRFTPLYNLFKIYKRDNDIENMKRIGNQILTKRIKIYSSEIEIIRHNTRVELQRLSQHEN